MADIIVTDSCAGAESVDMENSFITQDSCLGNESFDLMSSIAVLDSCIGDESFGVYNTFSLIDSCLGESGDLVIERLISIIDSGHAKEGKVKARFLAMDWPISIQKPGKIDEEIYKGQYKNELAGKYTQVTQKFTRARKRFDLEWGHEDGHCLLYDGDREILEEFFSKYAGIKIRWTNNQDGNVYYVAFAEDEISFEQVQPGYHSCSLSLEEF